MSKWKDVVDYFGLYQVSENGEVRSMPRRGCCGGVLKQVMIGEYLSVNLSKDGKAKIKRVHKLVAESFIPNKEEKLVVNHIDGNKLNNNVLNLEWATHKENTAHAIKNGLRKLKKPNKKNPEQIRELLKRGATYNDIRTIIPKTNPNFIADVKYNRV